MRLICLLIVLFLVCSPALPDTAKEPFVAIIASQNLQWMLHQRVGKYHFDYEAAPLFWEDVPAHLEKIAKAAGSRPILLDFYVHGNDSGLYLEGSRVRYFKLEETSDRASFGWVLQQVDKYLKDKPFTLLFESCYAGRAYHNTIRGDLPGTPLDNVADYKTIPPYPVWGMGDSFSGIGPMMYLQWKYNFRRWWIDLREFDSLGKNKKIAPEEPEIYTVGTEHYSQTTWDIKKVWEFFLEQIP